MNDEITLDIFEAEMEAQQRRNTLFAFKPMNTDNEAIKKKTRMYTQDEAGEMDHEVLMEESKIFDDVSSINNYEKKISHPSREEKGDSSGRFAILEMELSSNP